MRIKKALVARHESGKGGPSEEKTATKLWGRVKPPREGNGCGKKRKKTERGINSNREMDAEQVQNTG